MPQTACKIPLPGRSGEASACATRYGWATEPCRRVRRYGTTAAPISAPLFRVFADGAERLIGRAWLIDPMRAQVGSAATLGDPGGTRNGELYGSFGHGESRSWEDAVEHGFICAGGGSWYSRTPQVLGPGDRVWVRVPKSGFVGVGRVTGASNSPRTS